MAVSYGLLLKEIKGRQAKLLMNPALWTFRHTQALGGSELIKAREIEGGQVKLYLNPAL